MGSRGSRGSAVRGEPTTVSPWPARERWVPSGRRRSGGGSTRWADQYRGRCEVGQAPRRHSLACARSRSGTGRAHAAGEMVTLRPRRLSPMFAGVGTQWSGICATEWSGAAAKLGVRHQWGQPSAAMLRRASSRVWAGGATSKQSLPSAATGRSECSAEDGPAVGAGLASRRQTRGRDSTRAAKRRVLPKPVRKAANFCADIARLNASHWQAGFDCNHDSRTPRRVQGARCSERAGDPGSLTPQKPARCASGAR